MTEGNQSDWWAAATQDLHYRCVCGNELSFEAKATSIECPKCHRVYGKEAFQNTVDHSLRTQAFNSSTTWSDLATEIPSVNMELRSGERIEHFKIVDVLGKGGMGAVYRAVDESLERYVALKVIKKKIAKSNQSEYEHLLQEARAQARLNHPNVVQIFYVQHKSDAETPFFAMELVQGETLEDLLKYGEMEFSEVIEVSLQIVDALKHARAFDTVHGDIKPSNILFASPKTVKLADFGLSRKISETEDEGEAGLVGGTPAYLSPEIARGESSDFRSDQYSLGVMMFQMSFGRMPYKIKRKVLQGYLEAHKHSEINFPSKWPNTIPERWKILIERLMSKKPEDRFENYDDLISELKSLRPQQYPTAGRLSRGLAWLIDLSISFGLNFVFVLPIVSKLDFIKNHPILNLFALVLLLVVPYTVCFLQGYWNTSPGKKLFQICIMDKHGKPLSRSKLELRMAMQMFPLLVLNVGVAFQLLSMNDSNLAKVSMLCGSLFFLGDFVFGIFAKERRSLHDRIIGTRVVLDLSKHENMNREKK